ncbi:Ccc1 family [Microdochium bolleyi]|uniref:Ccc1 family n=1 Tax=Microdochium bolleyi TaxID=196109 RepID=A0A136J8N3_9PEZI|nr:Ccc1 family [Microdochium bolleyi]
MSFLGRSDAVILAGLAELCAGSISMGIGGFLAARDTLRQQQQQEEQEVELHGVDCAKDDAGLSLLHGQRSGCSSERSSSSFEDHCTLVADDEALEDEKESTLDMSHRPDIDLEREDERAIRQHLEPLHLPEPAILEILATMQRSSSTAPLSRGNVRKRLSRFYNSSLPGKGLDQSTSGSDYEEGPRQRQHPPRPSTVLGPLLSGLIIALGYTVGGLIPLLPYFFAATIEASTRWSLALCMVALFTFGAGKYWLLQGPCRSVGNGGTRREERWKLARKCSIEGVQMLVLGMLAAGAAVECVQLVNDRTGGS